VIGDVAPDRWQSAWSALVARMRDLRTFFEEDASVQLRRRIAQAMAVTLEFAVSAGQDRRTSPHPATPSRAFAHEHSTAVARRLVSVQEDGAHFFWLALHHAVGDGQSVGTLFNELTTLLADGSLPPPGDSGKVFASREQLYFCSERRLP